MSDELLPEDWRKIWYTVAAYGDFRDNEQRLRIMLFLQKKTREVKEQQS